MAEVKQTKANNNITSSKGAAVDIDSLKQLRKI